MEKIASTEIGTEFNFSEKKFSDQIRLHLKAGDGGSGGFSYYRDYKVRRGAPDGGTGGRGGHIFLKATESVNDFRIFQKFHIKGNNGKPGKPRGKGGKDGGDLYLNVPIGTTVYEITGEELNPGKKKKFRKSFIVDLNEKGKSFMVAKGGNGGIGNYHRRELKAKQLGSKGQDKEIYIELRVLADIGLVGFPNVGKSTFLASISRAIPKIANYPFTTLNPTVGKVKFVDQIDFTVADIPGIIEDAHIDKGLGIEFLRHIDRTHGFVYILDLSIVEEKSLMKQFATLKNELDSYKTDFSNRPSIIVVNKADTTSEAYNLFSEFSRQSKIPSYLASIKHGIGLGEIVMAMRTMVESKKIAQKEEEKRKDKNYEIRNSEL